MKLFTITQDKIAGTAKIDLAKRWVYPSNTISPLQEEELTALELDTNFHIVPYSKGEICYRFEVEHYNDYFTLATRVLALLRLEQRVLNEIDCIFENNISEINITALNDFSIQEILSVHSDLI